MYVNNDSHLVLKYGKLVHNTQPKFIKWRVSFVTVKVCNSFRRES